MPTHTQQKRECWGNKGHHALQEGKRRVTQAASQHQPSSRPTEPKPTRPTAPRAHQPPHSQQASKPNQAQKPAGRRKRGAQDIPSTPQTTIIFNCPSFGRLFICPGPCACACSWRTHAVDQGNVMMTPTPASSPTWGQVLDNQLPPAGQPL